MLMSQSSTARDAATALRVITLGACTSSLTYRWRRRWMSLVASSVSREAGMSPLQRRHPLPGLLTRETEKCH